MSALQVVFMGTADLACASLAALADDPAYAVAAVVTQPDRPKGRSLHPQPSPVKTLAERRRLPVLQPERARAPEFLETLRQLRPDLIVVAAYGQILPQALLDLPRHGCINVHTSLLPKFRGAAPIQWAILSGDAETGVTIMQMDAGLDTGPILTQRAVPIGHDDTAQTLHDRLAEVGARLLVETIPGYVDGRIAPRAQPPEGATYARKITKEDGRMDWAQPARTLLLRLRAFTPWPGSYTFHPSDGKPALIKVWSAALDPGATGSPGEVVRADKAGLVVACGAEGLVIRELQREGGRRVTAPEFLAGHRVQVGEKFG